MPILIALHLELKDSTISAYLAHFPMVLNESRVCVQKNPKHAKFTQFSNLRSGIITSRTDSRTGLDFFLKPSPTVGRWPLRIRLYYGNSRTKSFVNNSFKNVHSDKNFASWKTDRAAIKHLPTSSSLSNLIFIWLFLVAIIWYHAYCRSEAKFPT